MAKGGNGTRGSNPTGSASGRTGRYNAQSAGFSESYSAENLARIANHQEKMIDTLKSFAEKKGARFGYGNEMYVNYDSGNVRSFQIGIDERTNRGTVELTYITRIGASATPNAESKNLSKFRELEKQFVARHDSVQEAYRYAEQMRKKINKLNIS